MSSRTEDIRLDADWLSLDYLTAEFIWDPAVRKQLSATINTTREVMPTERRSLT